MKIIGLYTENIKNLKVVEINPKGGAIILTGKNGAGKSAVLDSLFMALTGKKIKEPIRNGESRAEIKVDLGEYTVKKIFTGKGDRLEVMSKEGMTPKSPQAFLNNLLGELSFDPLEYSRMKPQPQRGILLKIAGLNFTKEEEKKINLFNERTIVNREVKTLESQLSVIPKPSADTPEKEISFDEEIKKIRVLEGKKEVFDNYEDEEQQRIEEVEKLGDEIDEIEHEIEQAQIRVKALSKQKENLEKEQEKLIAPEEITHEQIAEAQNELSKIEGKNMEIRNAQKFFGLEGKTKKAKEETDAFTSQLLKIEKNKIEKIKNAEFPLAGLSVSDETVLFEGKPFSQLSTGEQIKVSTAIAMKLNPTLKIILIREGALLDQAGLNSIIAIAKDNDYQLWIEKTADKAGVGIYLEAGEVK